MASGLNFLALVDTCWWMLTLNLLIGDLQATLDYEESLYQEHLVRRKQLIQKWSQNGREIKV
jgi:hypothetical protein